MLFSESEGDVEFLRDKKRLNELCAAGDIVGWANLAKELEKKYPDRLRYGGLFKDDKY